MLSLNSVPNNDITLKMDLQETITEIYSSLSTSIDKLELDDDDTEKICSLLSESGLLNHFVFKSKRLKSIKPYRYNKGSNAEEKEVEEYYTPMQFASKYGLVSMATILLKKDIDPNYRGESPDRKLKKNPLMKQKSTDVQLQATNGTKNENCRKPPVLLAAKYGHPEILRLFKYYNSDAVYDGQNVSIHIVNEESEDEYTHFIKTTSKPKVQFNVVNEGSKETVLHKVLRQSLLEKQRIREHKERASRKVSQRELTLNNTIDESKSSHLKSLIVKDRELHELSEDYRKCINILLDMDVFKSNDSHNKTYPTQFVKS